MGGTCETLTVEEIVAVNRALIDEYGGTFYEGNNNLNNLNSLEYALGAIQAVVFGEELFPSLAEKAAVLCHEIIAMHIFFDGNKRTGLAVAQLFLQLNGYDLRLEVSEALRVTLGIATGALSREELTLWIEAHLVPFDLRGNAPPELL